MELAGDEKKIQALFREQKLADELAAPEFISVWKRAQATSPERPRLFKPRSLMAAMAMTVIAIALCSLLLWSRNSQRAQQPSYWDRGRLARRSAQREQNYLDLDRRPRIDRDQPNKSSTLAPPPAPAPTQLVAAKQPVRIKPNHDRKIVGAALRGRPTYSGSDLGRPTYPGRDPLEHGYILSIWQSPTAMLLQSPADDVLSSLPQLDQSLTELKTFLPNPP
jgi:hypothetical protein